LVAAHRQKVQKLLALRFFALAAQGAAIADMQNFDLLA